ncbi:alpha/beta hydrolase [Streptomyces sp. NPDC002994]|uniref:alpha/beta hydrolase family protein n=1 Tax=Streptomyces sp. NPDC002994 TaxID=3154441 RepID=UPI0033A20D6C
MTMTRRAVVTLLALMLPLPLAGAASAIPVEAAPSVAFAALQPDRLELPSPTGPHAVGLTTLPLTDTSRTDHWVPSAGARELLISMHYPARRGTGTAPARPYMTAEEARRLLEKTASWKLIPRGNEARLSATRTHARDNARPTPGKFPLLVLSPGFGLSRMTMTSLAEELASRGYVVASVDHAYESYATEFPGKGVLPCTACTLIGPDRPTSEVAQGRARDVSFVLDTLTGPARAWPYARMINAKRIGMAGHSVGGNGASQAMVTDRRIRAGANVDGGFHAPIPQAGLDGRPFMLFGNGNPQDPGEWNWETNWPRLDGWKRWIQVTGSHHFSFIDLPALADQVPDATIPPGAPSGKRSAEITRDYVTAFFDLHLKKIPQPLLDGPTPANPEVVFTRS